MTCYTKKAGADIGDGGSYAISIHPCSASVVAKPMARELVIKEHINPSKTHSCRKSRRVGYSKERLWKLRKTATSLCFTDIPGTPFALTLTTQQCPEPRELKKILSNICGSLRRWGCSRWLYAIEWEKHDAAPHVHWLVYAPDEAVLQKVVSNWMCRMRHCEPRLDRQYVKPCYDALGWAMYLAKPKQKQGFESSAMRSGLDWRGFPLWSYSRSWLFTDPVKVDVAAEEAANLKRMFKGFQASKVPSEDFRRKRQIRCSLRREWNRYYSCESLSGDSAIRMLKQAIRIAASKRNDKERSELLSAPGRYSGVSRNCRLVMMLRRTRVEIQRKKRLSQRELY